MGNIINWFKSFYKVPNQSSSLWVDIGSKTKYYPSPSISPSPSPSLECDEEMRISDLIEKLELMKNVYGNLKLIINGYNKHGNLKPVTSANIFTIENEDGWKEDHIYID